MASLVVGLPAEVAHAPEMSAAESFSQSSTRVEKPSEAPPAAANVAQTTVAEPAAPPVETGQTKPPPPDAANGSTAAGSPVARGDPSSARSYVRLGKSSHSSSIRLFSLRIRRRYKQVRPSDPRN